MARGKPHLRGTGTVRRFCDHAAMASRRCSATRDLAESGPRSKRCRRRGLQDAEGHAELPGEKAGGPARPFRAARRTRNPTRLSSDSGRRRSGNGRREAAALTPGTSACLRPRLPRRRPVRRTRPRADLVGLLVLGHRLEQFGLAHFKRVAPRRVAEVGDLFGRLLQKVAVDAALPGLQAVDGDEHQEVGETSDQSPRTACGAAAP